jgi:hypothetical protein
MKKLAVAAAIAAVGAIGFWFSQQPGQMSVGTQGANAVLEYVPADTPIFSGQLRPFPLRAYLNSVAGNYQNYQAIALPNDADMGSSQAKFFASLYKAYISGLKSPELLLSSFGLPDTLQAYAYTLGAVPVLKWQIANPEAFWALLDKAEQDSGFTHRAGDMAGQAYRAYELLTLDEGGADTLELLFAQKDGMMTATLIGNSLDPELLALALEQTKPEQSLADAGTLGDIASAHGFMDMNIGFINHVEIVKALTTHDGNMLAAQLVKLFADGEDPFDELKTQECRTELLGIAANWPRTVVGLKGFSVTDEHSDIDTALVVESHNSVIMAALKKMRGFIPAYARDVNDGVFAMGLGLNVAELTPALGEIWQDLQRPSFACAPLAEMQAQLSEQNPAMLGMMTGMVNGVKGIGLSLLDYSLGTQQGTEPVLESLDALVSLSADNPGMLFDMVKPFLPMLADVQLIPDAEPVDMSARLMYTGDKGKALADSLARESVTVNGLYSMSADYGRMFTPMVTLLEMTGERVPPEFSMMKDYDMRLQMSLNIADEGLVMGSQVNTKARAVN